MCTNLSPLVVGHLYSGERDTFFGLRVLSLTSIQGTPWQSTNIIDKFNCPPVTTETAFKTWINSLKSDVLHLWEFNTQHRRDHYLATWNNDSLKCHTSPPLCRFRSPQEQVPFSIKYVIRWLLLLLLILLLLLLQCNYGTVTGAT